MSKLETLYLRLPTVLQQAACSAEGWRIARRRYDPGFFQKLSAAEDRTFWSEDRLKNFRDERLRGFVADCARTVPYYRRKFREWGVAPADIRGLDDLQKIPVLTRDEVREHWTELTSEAVPRSLRLLAHTSGTTGSGLHFFTTLSATQEQWATWWRYRRWHGIRLDTWCACFTGRSVVPVRQTRPPWWRYNYPMRQILFSGYHMSEANLEQYVSELRKTRPPWLFGYPSMLALLASYLVETGADLGYRIQWVTTASENLLVQQAELMRYAFGTRPLQHYGMTEAAANFSECECGRLHVDEDFAAVEFLRNANGGFRVVGTNLSNPCTALLRYEVQDVATVGRASCPCGRNGRVVEAVDGRLEDYVTLKNGVVLGRLDHVFKDLVRIREAQIYQPKPGEIVVRVVPARGYSGSDDAALLVELRKRIGEAAEIRVEHVDRLARGANGKLRLVISSVTPDLTAATNGHDV